jgi:hypothetical protein
MADSFPASLRASGMGLVMGVARIASAFAPALAGIMFAHGMTRASVSLIFAVEPLVATLVIGTFRRRSYVSVQRRV